MTSTADLRAQAVQLAGSLDADRMTGEQAAAALDDLAVADRALAGTVMFLGLRVARTDAWRGQGFQSAADWLAAKVGVSVREAHRLLGTARKADRLPKTKDAMRRGDLSPDQADAVAGAASVDPSSEDDLLDTAANDTHKKLQEEAARRRAAATDSADREGRIRSQRSIRRFTDADGAFNLHWRGPAVDGARLEAMLRPHEEQAFRTGRRSAVRDTFENRSYDAMMALLGIAPSSSPPSSAAPTSQEAADPSGANGGSDPAASPSSTAKVPGGNNVKVIVRIDHDALVRGHTMAGETCDIVGVGPISVAASRELMRDAFLAAVITKGRDVVNVAHLGRGLNAHQRTAIEAMGLRCSNIACNRTIAIQIDHRVPYAQDPVTALANQDPLCPECHRRKTHHGYHLEPGSGPRRFLRRDPQAQASKDEAGEARGPTRIEQPTLC